MPHLLVTNDFPPKVGGIQTYLHELWRRMPPDEVTVLTAAHPDAAAWDEEQPFTIERVSSSVLVPSPGLISRINETARRSNASIVLLDPAFPLGSIGPQLERPYGVVLHGAEVTIPARTPFLQLLLRRTMRGASLVIAAGGYPDEQGRYSAGRDTPSIVVPPGVDGERFRPLAPDVRAEVRARYGLEPDHVVVLGVSRLVNRKGFDVLIQAAAFAGRDIPELRVLIAGEGRDRGRLERLIEAMDAPVQLVGSVPDDALPQLYGSADIFAMACRDRWFGLEQEGFGIVFLEAAAAGLPAIAGASGGAAEAVVDGLTGVVLQQPQSVEDVQDALAMLVDDPIRRRSMGEAARERALRDFDEGRLSAKLLDAIRNAVPLPPVDTDGIDVNALSLGAAEPVLVGASAFTGGDPLSSVESATAGVTGTTVDHAIPPAAELADPPSVPAPPVVATPPVVPEEPPTLMPPLPATPMPAPLLPPATPVAPVRAVAPLPTRAEPGSTSIPPAAPPVPAAPDVVVERPAAPVVVPPTTGFGGLPGPVADPAATGTEPSKASDPTDLSDLSDPTEPPEAPPPSSAPGPF